MNTLTSDKAIILVVDSDPVLLTGTAAVLHSAGYECHCARDTQGALKAARTLSLDLIICDVLLDGESGLDLCKHMRKLPGCLDVPVMFVSSQQLPDIIRRSYEAGAAYYLRKPFDPEVLVELVSKALWMPHLVKGKLRNQSGKRFDLAGPPISAPAMSPASLASAVSSIGPDAFLYAKREGCYPALPLA